MLQSIGLQRVGHNRETEQQRQIIKVHIQKESGRYFSGENEVLITGNMLEKQKLLFPETSKHS